MLHLEEPEEEEDAPSCRFCLAAGAVVVAGLDPLLSPCDCRGSARYVHAACLQRWREQPASWVGERGALRATFCPVCLARYTLPPWFEASFGALPRPPRPARRRRRGVDYPDARLTPWTHCALSWARLWLVVHSLALLAEADAALRLAPTLTHQLVALMHVAAILAAVARLPPALYGPYLAALLPYPQSTLLLVHAWLLATIALCERVDGTHPTLPLVGLVHGTLLLPMYIDRHERALLL